MDPFDPRMRQMAAIDALGGALAGDSAVLDSPVPRQVFTFHVASGEIQALAVSDDTVTPYTLTSAAPALARELLAMREQEKEKWDGAILRLDKSSSSLGMEFLFGGDADLLDPAVTPLVDLATAVRMG